MNFLTNRFFSMILPAILKNISPVLSTKAVSLLDDLKITANSTPNPFDDILVVFLEDMIRDIGQGMG